LIENKLNHQKDAYIDQNFLETIKIDEDSLISLLAPV